LLILARNERRHAVVVAVLVGLAILAGSFALYRWRGGDDQRGKAESAAKDLAAYCKRQGAQCEVSRVEPISDDLWRFHIRTPDRGTGCADADLKRFQATSTDSVYVGGSVEGVTVVPCGPEWWTPEEAASRLKESAWGNRRNAALVTCLPLGETDEPTRAAPVMFVAGFNRRFRCRYSVPGGDGVVTFATTGSKTFEVESSR
jgi:hypothetical protein